MFRKKLQNGLFFALENKVFFALDQNQQTENLKNLFEKNLEKGSSQQLDDTFKLEVGKKTYNLSQTNELKLNQETFKTVLEKIEESVYQTLKEYYLKKNKKKNLSLSDKTRIIQLMEGLRTTAPKIEKKETEINVKPYFNSYLEVFEKFDGQIKKGSEIFKSKPNVNFENLSLENFNSEEKSLKIGKIKYEFENLTEGKSKITYAKNGYLYELVFPSGIKMIKPSHNGFVVIDGDGDLSKFDKDGQSFIETKNLEKNKVSEILSLEDIYYAYDPKNLKEKKLDKITDIDEEKYQFLEEKKKKETVSASETVPAPEPEPEPKSSTNSKTSTSSKQEASSSNSKTSTSSKQEASSSNSETSTPNFSELLSIFNSPDLEREESQIIYPEEETEKKVNNFFNFLKHQNIEKQNKIPEIEGVNQEILEQLFSEEGFKINDLTFKFIPSNEGISVEHNLFNQETLKQIYKKVFAENFDIKTMSFSKNPNQKITEQLQTFCEKLKKEKLKDQKSIQTEFSPNLKDNDQLDLKDFKNLKTLDLGANQITSLKDIQGLDSLTNLEKIISPNTITSVPEKLQNKVYFRDEKEQEISYKIFENYFKEKLKTKKDLEKLKTKDNKLNYFLAKIKYKNLTRINKTDFPQCFSKQIKEYNKFIETLSIEKTNKEIIDDTKEIFKEKLTEEEKKEVNLNKLNQIFDRIKTHSDKTEILLVINFLFLKSDTKIFNKIFTVLFENLNKDITVDYFKENFSQDLLKQDQKNLEKLKKAYQEIKDEKNRQKESLNILDS
jgi:hypothetical protein